MKALVSTMAAMAAGLAVFPVTIAYSAWLLSHGADAGRMDYLW